LPICATLLAAAIALVLPPSYTGTTTFVPAVGGNLGNLPGGLASLATQFGLNIGTTSSVSPDFFAEILGSRELLQATLLSQFDDPGRSSTPRTLLDILDARGRSEHERISEGVRRLEKSISQRVDRRTGIVTLSVKGRSPTLAAAIANRMVELLNKFNLERLQSQSRERRRFAGERKDQAEQELRNAEAQHLRFLQSNRRYADSPLLSFEQNRLARQVQLRQEVFQTLTREYEEARIAEVRDTPVLTIIDPAVAPDRRSFPQRKMIVFLVLLASLTTALALGYLIEYHRAAQLEDGSEYRRFVQAWGNAKTGLLAALRVGRR
jgi:uncharacterized protein involved in exopolysaccharide biosynthesis